MEFLPNDAGSYAQSELMVQHGLQHDLSMAVENESRRTKRSPQPIETDDDDLQGTLRLVKRYAGKNEHSSYRSYQYDLYITRVSHTISYVFLE